MRESAMNAVGAVSLVFHAQRYRYLAMGLFAFGLTFYAFTLPATYTGGVIGLISLRYLNAELFFFSVALAALLSVALTLNLYAFRASVRQRSGGLTLGALLSSLAPPSVCCTPLVPTLLAIFGASTPQIFGLTGRIQGFFATYEIPILGLALILLLFSVRLAAKSILGSCPLPATSLPSDGPTEENAPR